MSRLHTSLLDHNNPFLLTPQSLYLLPRRISNFPPVSVSILSSRRNLTVHSSAIEQRPSNLGNLIPALATSAALLFLTLGGVRSSACFAATSGRLPPAVAVLNDETLVDHQPVQGFSSFHFSRPRLVNYLLHLLILASYCYSRHKFDN